MQKTVRLGNNNSFKENFTDKIWNTYRGYMKFERYEMLLKYTLL